MKDSFAVWLIAIFVLVVAVVYLGVFSPQAIASAEKTRSESYAIKQDSDTNKTVGESKADVNHSIAEQNRTQAKIDWCNENPYSEECLPAGTKLTNILPIQLLYFCAPVFVLLVIAFILFMRQSEEE